MVAGMGIDLCDIERIGKMIEREHFINRVFTEREGARIRASTPVRRAEIAAGLFAAKEAVAKALGMGFDGFGPRDIEIIPDELGCPACTLYNAAAQRADNARVLVSITHERAMAAAVAIIERN